jgi:hypothetical protein
MLLQETQAGPDYLGLVIEATTRNETVDQPLEMGRNHFAHLSIFQ